jgi:hypothetical protein
MPRSFNIPSRACLIFLFFSYDSLSFPSRLFLYRYSLRRRAFLLKTPPDDMLDIYFPRFYGFLQSYRQISLQITSKTSAYSQTLQRNSMWIAHLLVHRRHSSSSSPSLLLSLFCIVHSSCLKPVIRLIYILTHQAITLSIQEEASHVPVRLLLLTTTTTTTRCHFQYLIHMIIRYQPKAPQVQ